MSIELNSFGIFSKTLFTSFLSETSNRRVKTFVILEISFEISSNLCCLLPHKINRFFSFANFLAVANPIPLVAPVISIVFKSLILSCLKC